MVGWRVLMAAGVVMLVGCGRHVVEEEGAGRGDGRMTDAPYAPAHDILDSSKSDGKSPQKPPKQAKSLPLPPDFPKDVYVYEDGVIEIAESVDSGFSLSIRSAGPEEKVAAIYMAEMTGRGWVHLSGDSPSLLMFTKDERVATVACLLIGDSLMVGVTVSRM